jgi:four helix bundle protein
MSSHEKLDAWQNAMSLVLHVYEITKGFPKEELFGLAQQMRRAAVSIPSNIAEGAARNSEKEYAHFISIARGSLAELETQYKIALSLKYCQESTLISEKINHLARLLTGLYKKWS